MAQRDAQQAAKRKSPAKAPTKPAAKAPAKAAAKGARLPAGKSSRSASKSAKSKSGDGGVLAGAVERLEAEVKSLTLERDTLSKDLEAARTQISELENAQTDAINRIDWVIDSLHNLMDQKN